MNVRILAGGLLLVVLSSLAYVYAQSNADIYKQAATNERNAAAQCPEPGRSCHFRMASYYDCIVAQLAGSGGTCTQPTCNASCTAGAAQMNTTGCPAGQAHPSLNNSSCAPIVGTRGTSGAEPSTAASTSDRSDLQQTDAIRQP